MSLADFYRSELITDPFGTPRGDSIHWGTDIEHDEGTPIPTPWDLMIVRCEWQDFHGWFVSGRRADGWHATFSHMPYNPGWSYGAIVPRGNAVGAVGTTGFSTGPHLHTQVTKSTMPWVHGSEVDPWPQIVQALTSTAGGGSDPFESEEDDMSRLNNIYISYPEDDGRQINVVFNPESGFWSPFESNAGGYNTDIATVFGIPITKPVSKSHALALEKACAAVRAGVA